MPELPEVETIAAGLRPWVVGRQIATVRVLHPRAVRRHGSGQSDFEAQLTGRLVEGVRRRGKYLWFQLDGGDAALIHLGMSGQMLLRAAYVRPGPHVRIQLDYADSGPHLHFVDQRTFGHMLVSRGGYELPAPIQHIAVDPFDESFDVDATVARVRRRSSEVKRVLLDQTVVSGIGNIYADEALWRARIHFARPANRLPRARVRDLLYEATTVMAEAVRAGGTSFDDLYVDVNGRSGYFERGLNVYGREGRPCPRCGATIRRARFTNRSSFFCPRCQRSPRQAH